MRKKLILTSRHPMYNTCCVPESKTDGSPVDHYFGGVVIEHRWDVLAWEGACRVADENACLSHRSIADYDALYILHIGQRIRIDLVRSIKRTRSYRN